MPVATYGALRGVGFSELSALGAQIALANAFHLHERPGASVIEAAGGLHGFTGWRGPWLTDSGGFQIASLAKRATVREQGVNFRSPLDGAKRELTPERAIAIQEALGADIAMVLDQVAPVEPGDQLRAQAVMERSLRWAERCKRAWRGLPGRALFGIVQGGAHSGLRRQSARATVALGFDGYAHGGLGLGETRAERSALVAETHAQLPVETPRYLMGLGRPEDLLAAIATGVDLFDCVVPTRHARHGLLFSDDGPLNIKNARYREDSTRPPDRDCDCSVCARHSRAFLRHLFLIGEPLGPSLASLHNLRYTLRLMQRARAAISAGRFETLHAELAARNA